MDADKKRKIIARAKEHLRKGREAVEKDKKEVSDYYQKPYEELTEQELSTYRRMKIRKEYEDRMNEPAPYISSCWLCRTIIPVNRTRREMMRLYDIKVRCSKCKIGSARFVHPILRKHPWLRN